MILTILMLIGLVLVLAVYLCCEIEAHKHCIDEKSLQYSELVDCQKKLKAKSDAERERDELKAKVEKLEANGNMLRGAISASLQKLNEASGAKH